MPTMPSVGKLSISPNPSWIRAALIGPGGAYAYATTQAEANLYDDLLRRDPTNHHPSNARPVVGADVPTAGISDRRRPVAGLFRSRINYCDDGLKPAGYHWSTFIMNGFRRLRCLVVLNRHAAPMNHPGEASRWPPALLWAFIRLLNDVVS